MEHLELIGKYLTEESSVEENESLLSWIQSNPENKYEFIEVCNIWHASAKVKKFDYKKAYHSFTTKTTNVAQTIVVETKTRSLWQRITIPVAAAVVVSVGLLYIFRPNIKNTTYSNNTNAVEKVTLPDGSVAYLNKAASLTAPSAFNGKTRPIAINGEVYFEITKNKAKPFVISIGSASVTVKGTTFNVAYDSSKGNCNVIVNSGTVVLAAQNNNAVTLTKDEKGFVNLKTNQVTESINNDINFLSWKTGILQFKNTQYKQVFNDVERHYGITIQYPSDLSNSLALTATFDHEDVNSTLKVIELMFNVKIDKQNSIFVVRK